jgi:hypothetical protein
MANLREQADMTDDTTGPGQAGFERRAEFPGRALNWRVTDRRSEDWRASDEPPRTETCIDCGQPTASPTLVRCIETASGPGGMLYACPDCAPRYAA